MKDKIEKIVNDCIVGTSVFKTVNDIMDLINEEQSKQLILNGVGCSLKNKQSPSFEEYLKLCYIKLNQNYRSKETLQNYSLEEIEQRYNWMKNL